MRGIDWLFLAAAVIAAAAALAACYYARNCQENTDLVIRSMLKMAERDREQR
jgi:hypothetical protein